MQSFERASEIPRVERPSIFTFIDYRSFLARMVEYLRAQNSYSIRKFARQVGLGSHSYLKMVVDRQRSLTEDSTRKISKGFEMTDAETEFFVLLVKWNEAKSANEREQWNKQITLFLKLRGKKTINENHYAFFARPHRVALYEALATPFRALPPDEMAKRLKISRAELDTSIKVLSDLELIRETSEGWQQTGAFLESSPEMRCIAARNFHREVLSQAIEAVDHISVEERNLQSLTLALSPAMYKDLVAVVTKMLKETNAVYSENKEATQIYHMALQIFPVAKLTDD